MKNALTIAVITALTGTMAFAAPKERASKAALEEARRELAKPEVKERFNSAKSEAQVINELAKTLEAAKIELTEKDLSVLDQVESLKGNREKKAELVLALSKAKLANSTANYYVKGVEYLIKKLNTTTDARTKADIISMIDNVVPFMGMEGSAAQKAQLTTAIYAFGLATGKHARTKQSLNATNDADLSTKAATEAISYVYAKELSGEALKAKIDEFLKKCLNRA